MRRPLLVRPAWLIRVVPSTVPPVGARPPPRIYRWEKTTAVAVKIKLKRLGKIREPYYRIVVADARTKRDGRAIEEIGKYHPKAEPSLIEVNSERVQHWLSVGAQPTDPVRVLLKITGDWQKFTGEPGTEGTLRTAEPRTDKKERFTAAAKESQAGKEDKAASQSKAPAQSRTARPAKASTAQASPARDGTARDGTARDGTARDGTAKVDVKTDAAKDDAAKDDAVKADAAKDDAVKADAAKDDAVKADAAKDDAVKADAAKADAAKADAAKADAVKAGATEEDAAKADASSASQPADGEAAAKPARSRAARTKDAVGDSDGPATTDPGSGA
jgi:small subunit ribosomal protein S16